MPQDRHGDRNRHQRPLALGLLTEAIGRRLPVVALPFINAAQAEHPAFHRSIEQLRKEGIRLLYGPDVLALLCVPHSLSEEVGLALWAQAGEQRLRKVVTAAGFGGFRRAAQTPFN